LYPSIRSSRFPLATPYVYTVQLDPPYRLTTLTRRPPHRSPLHLDRLVSIRTVAVMDCSPSNSCLLDDLVDVQTHSPDWTLSSPDAHAIEDPADAFTPSDFRSMQAQEVTDAQPTATPSLLDALLAIAGAEDGCAAPQNSMSSLTQPLPGSRLGLAQVGSSLQYSPCLELLPNELLLHVLGFLDVSDLLATSRATYPPVLLLAIASLALTGFVVRGGRLSLCLPFCFPSPVALSLVTPRCLSFVITPVTEQPASKPASPPAWPFVPFSGHASC
jgi:hypothetical protein